MFSAPSRSDGGQKGTAKTRTMSTPVTIEAMGVFMFLTYMMSGRTQSEAKNAVATSPTKLGSTGGPAPRLKYCVIIARLTMPITVSAKAKRNTVRAGSQFVRRATSTS